ncbi:heterokaryon incompatibility [Fusarium albosuccineum]|uniref:Heterokaryon incompatibility n=1 Tax=Fusarium albosuccineum TaxID=1237068 RepID=A0A8H4PJJ7_9HYPO|nr:heterokaryon incompatibility [Fusarium albosuccineum]
MAPRLYSRLPEERFRLIKLLPGKWDDTLKADLFEADQTFSYTALSYTWGSRRVLREVILNGTPKGITINLDLALRTLRSRHSPVIVWADALCINQEDVTDKSTQVSFMSQIFNWATQVRAYVGGPLDRDLLSYESRLKELGPSEAFQFSEDHDSAWEEIQDALSGLETRKVTELSPNQRCLCIFGFLRALSSRSLTLKLKSMDLFSGELAKKMEVKQRYLFEWLRVFVVAPWWDRMWITQEVGVARELLLTYGKVTMPFQTLATLVRELERSPLDIPSLAKENKRVIDLVVTKVKTISELRRLQQYKSICEMSDLDYFQRSLGSPLLWLLRTFRHRHSSEPRDKIYALSQLLKNLDTGSDHKLKTDYATTVAELFSRVAVQIMQETGLFWVTSADLIAKSRDNLPSWVPNWTDGFTTPDSGNVAWKIRLCHNASDLSFLAVSAETSGTTSLDPPQYYSDLAKYSGSSLWRKLQGAKCKYNDPFEHGNLSAGDATINSVHFFLDWENTEARRIQYEYHRPDIRDFTKIENCLKLPSHYCSTVRYVSEPIAPDLSNLFDILKGIKATHYKIFPGDWKYEYLHRVELIGRVLCFGAVLEESGDARRIEDYDEPDLAILVHLLTHLPSDERLESSTDWKDRCQQKALLESRSLCSICRDEMEPCTDCESQAEAKPPLSLKDAWKDPRIIQVHRTALQTAPGNCIIMTRDGTFALGPPQAQDGDRIAILSGGLCPYILRRDTIPQYLGNLAFQLVGDCFLEKAPKWDPEKLETVALV